MDHQNKLPDGWGDSQELENVPWGDTNSDTVYPQEEQDSILSEEEAVAIPSPKRRSYADAEPTALPQKHTVLLIIIIILMLIIIIGGFVVFSYILKQREQYPSNDVLFLEPEATPGVPAETMTEFAAAEPVPDTAAETETELTIEIPAEIKADTIPDWESAYTAVLRSYSTNASGRAMYDLMDINSDGIPELIISADDTYAGGMCFLYTCTDSGAVDLHYTGSGDFGEMLISPGNNLIVDYGGIQGLYHVNAFQLSGTALRQLDSYSSNTIEQKFSRSGKSITPEAYNTAMKSYNQYSFAHAGRQFQISDISDLSHKLNSIRRSTERIEFILADIPEPSVTLLYIGTGTPNSSDGFLNLRSSPELTDNIITEIRNGEKIDLYDCGNSDWYYVTYNGYEGYVKKSYVTDWKEPQNTPQITIQYIGAGTPDSSDGFLNLRSSPELTNNIITTIRNGEKIDLYDCGNTNWYYVKYNGYEGYAKKSYVTGWKEPQPVVTAPPPPVTNPPPVITEPPLPELPVEEVPEEDPISPPVPEYE